MGRLIVQEFVTLDGLAAGPQGEVDFIPAATEGDAGVAREPDGSSTRSERSCSAA